MIRHHTFSLKDAAHILRHYYEFPFDADRIQHFLHIQKTCAQYCVAELQRIYPIYPKPEIHIEPSFTALALPIKTTHKKKWFTPVDTHSLLYTGLYAEGACNIVENEKLNDLPCNALFHEHKYVESSSAIKGLLKAAAKTGGITSVYFTVTFRQHMFGVFYSHCNNKIYIFNTIGCQTLAGGTLFEDENATYFEFIKLQVSHMACTVLKKTGYGIMEAVEWHDMDLQGHSDCVLWSVLLPYLLPKIVAPLHPVQPWYYYFEAAIHAFQINSFAMRTFLRKKYIQTIYHMNTVISDIYFPLTFTTHGLEQHVMANDDYLCRDVAQMFDLVATDLFRNSETPTNNCTTVKKLNATKLVPAHVICVQKFLTTQIEFERYGPNSKNRQEERGPHCVGFASYELLQYLNIPVLWLYDLMVHPEFQRQGIGSYLLECAVQAACEHKRTHIIFDVFADNPNALIFYNTWMSTHSYLHTSSPYTEETKITREALMPGEGKYTVPCSPETAKHPDTQNTCVWRYQLILND